jgi:hypothetical protein
MIKFEKGQRVRFSPEGLMRQRVRGKPVKQQYGVVMNTPHPWTPYVSVHWDRLAPTSAYQYPRHHVERVDDVDG